MQSRLCPALDSGRGSGGGGMRGHGAGRGGRNTGNISGRWQKKEKRRGNQNGGDEKNKEQKL